MSFMFRSRDWCIVWRESLDSPIRRIYVESFGIAGALKKVKERLPEGCFILGVDEVPDEI